LCCAEVKKKRDGNNMVIHVLGGKRDDDKDINPKYTAARRFFKEIGGIIPLENCQRLLGFEHNNAAEILPIWCGHGKYVLYVWCLSQRFM